VLSVVTATFCRSVSDNDKKFGRTDTRSIPRSPDVKDDSEVKKRLSGDTSSEEFSPKVESPVNRLSISGYNFPMVNGMYACKAGVNVVKTFFFKKGRHGIEHITTVSITAFHYAGCHYAECRGA